ncbi:MAG: hypothetical protein [Cryophage ML09]|nr:MAG: hypothetical protein [Cryophage ML09]
MIPGGNDSFGTGISAGGAQVMGQSAGLNDLVKLGMARQRQRQVRPWNAPLQNIDTSKIKGVDAENIANFVNKGRDEYIAGNSSNDPTERYRHQMLSDNYMAQASELSRQSQDNNEKLKNFRTLAQGENVDPTLVDGINKKLRRFELAQSGTKESDDAEADMGDFRKYQKVDMSKLDMDARSLYEKQKIDTPSNMLGFQDVHSEERMHVNTTAMYHHYADYGRYNTAADNQFKQMGQEAMADSNNKTLIANLATRYPIDPTNPAQVGYAIKANDQYNTAKGYHVEGDHIIKPPHPISITIGGQDNGTVNQGPSNITVPMSGTNPDGTPQNANATLNYDKTYGNHNWKGGVAGHIFDADNSQWVNKKSLSNVNLIGSFHHDFYKDDITQKRMLTDENGKFTGEQAKDPVTGKYLFDNTNGGIILKSQEGMFKSNPEKAQRELRNLDMVHVTAMENGRLHNYYLPKEIVPGDAFPNDAKGYKGQVDKSGRSDTQTAVSRHNDAHPAIKSDAKVDW